MAGSGHSAFGKPNLSFIAGPSSPSLLDWTLNDVLHQRCLDQANDIAVISQHQNEQYSYAQLQDRSTQLAAGLHALGVRKGDRVGVLLGNRAEYVDVRGLPFLSVSSSTDSPLLDSVCVLKDWSILYAFQLRLFTF
jgi:long-chain acyl-CoA synthetase